jgi:ATP-dependent phosphofructokinase / diphosphate-dependent phosphofructokinase
MASVNTRRGVIGILGGGDVPGLNPAIRAVTNREGYRVIVRGTDDFAFGILVGNP